MLLTLDSSSMTGQQPNDFTVYFSSPLNISNGTYEIALLKCNLWYSFYNISAALGNNVFKYTNTSSVTKTVTFVDGNYTITQINDYLQGIMLNNGDYTVVSGVNTYSINILPNYSTLKVDISLTNSFTIDFTQSQFSLLLGWNQAVYNFSGTQSGLNLANINNDVNSLLIHCDIISQSYINSNISDVLYSFVPNSAPGSNIQVQPKPSMIYLPLRIPDFIYKIRMYRSIK